MATIAEQATTSSTTAVVLATNVILTIAAIKNGNTTTQPNP